MTTKVTIYAACRSLNLPLPVSSDDLKRTMFAIWDAGFETNVDNDCLRKERAEWLAEKRYRDAIVGARPDLTCKLVAGLRRSMK